MVDISHPAFKLPREEIAESQQKGLSEGSDSTSNSRLMSSTLSERIEWLDEETRSSWARVDDLEDEEASLSRRLVALEKIRRGERMQILSSEQGCQSVEMAMLKAQEEAAELDSKSQALECIGQEAAEGADSADTTTAAATVTDIERIPSEGGDGGGGDDSAQRLEGSAALSAAVLQILPHEEKRRQLMTLLQDTENKTRTEIAEAGRSTAELRRSAKKRDAEGRHLDRETSTLREELAAIAGEDELETRKVRARQTREGLQLRLQHATKKLESLRDSLDKGAARQLEEEERCSLELMQGIAEAKAKQHKRSFDRGYPRSSGSTTKRWSGAGGQLAPADGISDVVTKLEMRSPHDVGRRGQRHDQPQQRRRKNTWGGKS